MNFVSDKEDLSKIIKTYSVKGNNYSIEYMDGSESNFYCSNENLGKELRDTMIKQAIERQKSFDINFYDKLSTIDTTLLMFDLTILWPTLTYGNAKSISLVLLALGLATVTSTKINKTLKELKKYKLFLEMVDDVEYINKSDILKCVDFEPIYLKPFDINTLDDYTYGDVKKINKELKLRKQESNN